VSEKASLSPKAWRWIVIVVGIIIGIIIGQIQAASDTSYTTAGRIFAPSAFGIGYVSIPILIICLLIKAPKTIKITQDIKNPKTGEQLKEGREYTIRRADANWLIDNGCAVEVIKQKGGNNLNGEWSKFRILFTCAIVATVITFISALIFGIVTPSETDKRIESSKKTATAITVTGSVSFQSNSINRTYDVYLVEQDNRFFMFQIVGKEIRVYATTFTTNANKNAAKAAILNYFNVVKEEKLPVSLMAGDLLAASIAVPIILALGTSGLWVWWYLEKRKRIIVTKPQT
jgi:Na+/serine symporter